MSSLLNLSLKLHSINLPLPDNSVISATIHKGRSLHKSSRLIPYAQHTHQTPSRAKLCTIEIKHRNEVISLWPNEELVTDPRIALLVGGKDRVTFAVESGGDTSPAVTLYNLEKVASSGKYFLHSISRTKKTGPVVVTSITLESAPTGELEN